MLDTFDKVVLVNLRRRKDRLSNFYKELEKVGWQFAQPEVFEAIDGNLVPTPAGWEQGGGAWGCCQSHRQILERAIMDGVKHLLVLEDDAFFVSDFNEKVETFLSLVPKDFDGLCLGGQHMATPTKVTDGVVRCLNCQRTHAYSVRGKYMRDLYSKWCEPAQRVHIDWVMGPFQAGYKVYSPDPFLIGQDRSKSDINGAVNPRKMWVPPSQDAPLILFHGPREVLEGMAEHGWHPGHNRDRVTGIDRGLLSVFAATDPRRKLRDWVTTLQWEAASNEGSIVVVWHPLATLDVVRQSWGGPIHEISALTVQEALNAMPSGRARTFLPSNHFVVLLWASREVAEELAGYGLHLGYWRDAVTGLDNGLRQIFAEGATPEKLSQWIDDLTPEAEAMKGCVTFWHDQASAALVSEATDLRVVEITATTLGEGLEQWNAVKNEYATLN